MLRWWLVRVAFVLILVTGCSGPDYGHWATEEVFFRIGAPAFLSDGSRVLVHGTKLLAFNPQFGPLWEVPFQPGFWGEVPYVKNDMIYLYGGNAQRDDRAESSAYQLAALSLSGTPRWSAVLYGKPDGITFGADGSVYVGSSVQQFEPPSLSVNKGWVQQFSLDGGTGWEFNELTHIVAGPLLTDAGLLLVADWDTLFALDAESGAVRWQHELPEVEYTEASNLASRADIIFGRGTTLKSLDAEGSELWTTEIGELIKNLLVTADRIYCTTHHGELVTLSHAGSILWRRQLGDHAGRMLVALPGGQVCADDGRYARGENHMYVNCFDSSGAKLWEVERWEHDTSNVSPEGVIFTGALVAVSRWTWEPRLLAISPAGAVETALMPSEVYLSTYWTGVSPD